MEAFEFDQATGCVTLRGELTIYQAQQAHTLLLEAANTGRLRVLDLAGVTEIDSAGLQLVLCTRYLSGAQPVAIINASEPVLSVLSLLKLDGQVLNQAAEIGA